MIVKRSIHRFYRRTFPVAIVVTVVVVITLTRLKLRAQRALPRAQVISDNIRNHDISDTHGIALPNVSYGKTLSKTNKTHFVSETYPHINILQYSGYRTGSTFISLFLNQHRGVFYAFEPEKVPDSKREILTPQILDALYSCDLNPSGPLSNINRIWLHRDVFCHLKPPTEECTPSLPSAQKRCERSEIRVVKLIALPKLSLTESLLRRGVRVVHTVRDPRGTIDSLHGIGECKGMESTTNCSQDYCERILQDLDFIHRLRDIYGDQILQLYLLVRYEDFAIEAVQNMKKLYHFLGVQPDIHTRKWAKETKAKSSLKDAGPQRHDPRLAYNIYRFNPAATSQAWRFRMTWETIQSIQQQDACRKVMDILQYRIYNDITALLNMDASSSADFNMSNLFKPTEALSISYINHDIRGT